ncbi:MAG TPA: hypothetical protein VH951_01620 [Dehalococcoidia bacterium]|jgi:hypothetical protein
MAYNAIDLTDRRSGEALIAWAAQGTVDYRVSLDKEEFAALGLEPPSEDLELFVPKADVQQMIAAVTALGHDVVATPGGSPLVSTLAAVSWLESHPESGASARFFGAVPDALPPMLPEQRRHLLDYATTSPDICGTLALEYATASAKLMMSVPEGRWLDEELAALSLSSLRSAIQSARPARLLFGLGGLNKSNPSVAGELIRTVRSLAPDVLVFVSGSSFKRTPSGAPPDFWPDLYRVLSEADIVSLSREEWGQLSARWGTAWAQRLLESFRTEMIVIHSRESVDYVASRRLSGVLGRPESLLSTARERASEYAARALTGLGARFDGVLSTLIAAEWRAPVLH